MRYVISKDFTFSASHRLAGLPLDHPCSRLHGHNYTVRVELSSDELDTADMVFDYGDLARFGDLLNDRYDHRHLNDDMPQRRRPPVGRCNPTAETLAALFLDAVRTECKIPDHIDVAVGVSETPKTWAWVRP